MDQSEIGYPTPPHDNNVVPELQRGKDGWSGRGWSAEGETWRVVDNVIKVKFSDGNHNRVPSWEQRLRTVDDEGNFSHYLQLGKDHHLYQLWMRKIGRYLADWVLGKSLYGASNGYPFTYPGLALTRGKKIT